MTSYGLQMVESGGCIIKKCQFEVNANAIIIFTINYVLNKHNQWCIQTPTVPLGIGCVWRGGLQQYIALGVSFELQFCDSPPVHGWGGVGLDIDRCIN